MFAADIPKQAVCRTGIIRIVYPTRIHTAFKYSVSGTVADIG